MFPCIKTAPLSTTLLQGSGEQIVIPINDEEEHEGYAGAKKTYWESSSSQSVWND